MSRLGISCLTYSTSSMLNTKAHSFLAWPCGKPQTCLEPAKCCFNQASIKSLICNSTATRSSFDPPGRTSPPLNPASVDLAQQTQRLHTPVQIQSRELPQINHTNLHSLVSKLLIQILGRELVNYNLRSTLPAAVPRAAAKH